MKTLEQMSAGEVFEIITVVVKAMEKAKIKTSLNTELKENETKDKWYMEFKQDEVNYKDLKAINAILGDAFNIGLSFVKKSFLVKIEANPEAFVNLTRQKSQQIRNPENTEMNHH